MRKIGPKAESYISHFCFMSCKEAIGRKICPFHFSLKSNMSPQVEWEQVYCHTGFGES